VRFDKSEDLREHLTALCGKNDAYGVMDVMQKGKPNIPHSVLVNGKPMVVTWHVYTTLEDSDENGN
jgi:hypothetical protein